MNSTDELSAFAKQNGFRVYEVPAGIGVRFADGNDVYWALPKETWHFLNSDPTVDHVAAFQSLNERRQRVIDCVRRYLFKQKVYPGRCEDGVWNIAKTYGSCEYSVGARLTQSLLNKDDLVSVIQDSFEGTIVPKPSTRRVQRHLSQFGDPIEDFPWEEPDEPLISQTPLAVVGWMGLCRAIQDDENFDSADAFIEAAKPKGRIGRALVQFASRLRHAKASVEVCDGTLDVEFPDGFGEFSVQPKSEHLRVLIHKHGDEAAGDRLADQYEQQSKQRSAAINAIFGSLKEHGYFGDKYQDEHFGREFRELNLDLGDALTKLLAESGVEQTIATLLIDNQALAQTAIANLEKSLAPIELPRKILAPVAPPPMKLEMPSPKRMDQIDAWSKNILDKYRTSDAALATYRDRFYWDPSADTWTSQEHWIALAKTQLGKRYPRLDAQMILIDAGDDERMRTLLETYRQGEPHHEADDAEIEIIWRNRHTAPEVATKWFRGNAFDDVPYASTRAVLGDPIAARYVIAAIDHEENEDDDIDCLPEDYARIPVDLIRQFTSPKDIGKLREKLRRWASETWRWQYGDDGKALSVACHLGWTEVADLLVANPHLVHGLFAREDGEDRAIMFAGRLMLAWVPVRTQRFPAEVGYRNPQIRSGCDGGRNGGDANRVDQRRDATGSRLPMDPQPECRTRHQLATVPSVSGGVVCCIVRPAADSQPPNRWNGLRIEKKRKELNRQKRPFSHQTDK